MSHGAEAGRALYRSYLRVIRELPRYIVNRVYTTTREAFEFRSWQARVIMTSESGEGSVQLFEQWRAEAERALNGLRMLSKMDPAQQELMWKPVILRQKQQARLIELAREQGLEVPSSVEDKIRRAAAKEKRASAPNPKKSWKTEATEARYEL